jgi:dipeptidyl aminopeptidase/acylaminoacyl peptidase
LTLRRTFTRHLRALLTLLLCVAVPLHAAPDPAAAPIERFFINPVLSDAELSPSGRYLAAISGASSRRDFLIVIDLQEKTAKLVAGYDDVDILAFEWVNDGRLVFNVTDKQVALGDRHMAGGLYAVDRDGANLIQLAQRGGAATTDNGLYNPKMLSAQTFMLGQQGAQDSQFIYVGQDHHDKSTGLTTVILIKVDTVTGAHTVVPRPGPVDTWRLDHKGEPRLATFSHDGTTTFHYRDPETSAWRVLVSFPTYQGSAGAYSPLGFGDDGILYATANAGRDTSALYTVNLATGALIPEPLVQTPGYDFQGSLIRSGSRILGVRLLTDAEGTVWFDPAIQSAQIKLDAALPGTINLMSFSSRRVSEWALVVSYSDVKPKIYRLFNLLTGEIDKVGEAYPNIDPARMGRQDPVRYRARDGREIPALLTLPAKGTKNAPLVVLVHGGPFVRGTEWGWAPDTQFLASRGYAVLEPEFRGSTGYGVNHFKAGWKQWGLAMQDDIADGARWAIAQGIADPQRICIAGASYGGYATLMGLINDPDLYKCGVSWVGITDINLMYDGHWSLRSDLSEEWKRYGMPDLIGDQVKDAAQLIATSPIKQAARIKAPLLLAYGNFDQRVPIYHGRQFMAAIKPHNKRVEWIAYPDEGHGWGLPKNRVDFWSRVEKFLDKHIGSGAKTN